MRQSFLALLLYFISLMVRGFFILICLLTVRTDIIFYYMDCYVVLCS